MTEQEMRAVQNYATNHVLVQPPPIALSNVGQMAVVQKLYPYAVWPAGPVGVPSGLPTAASPLYYMNS